MAKPLPWYADPYDGSIRWNAEYVAELQGEVERLRAEVARLEADLRWAGVLLNQVAGGGR